MNALGNRELQIAQGTRVGVSVVAAGSGLLGAVLGRGLRNADPFLAMAAGIGLALLAGGVSYHLLRDDPGFDVPPEAP